VDLKPTRARRALQRGCPASAGTPASLRRPSSIPPASGPRGRAFFPRLHLRCWRGSRFQAPFWSSPRVSLLPPGNPVLTDADSSVLEDAHHGHWARSLPPPRHRRPRVRDRRRRAATTARCSANPNRRPAGRLHQDTLRVALVVRMATWAPDGEYGPSIAVPAFGADARTPGGPGRRGAADSSRHSRSRRLEPPRGINRGVRVPAPGTRSVPAYGDTARTTTGVASGDDGALTEPRAGLAVTLLTVR
jgi:hypothetical protein